ncbi:hypothetical protein HNR29_006512 [Rhizobium leguminosarum]|nr:hypothetical protein [Rhizobium leguminosarum]
MAMVSQILLFFKNDKLASALAREQERPQSSPKAA